MKSQSQKQITTELKFRFEIWNETKKEEFELNQEDARNFDFEKFDCCLAKSFGKEGFRDKNSRWQDFKNNGRGPGDMAGELLKTLMRNPGIHMDKWMLKQLSGYDNLTAPGILPPRIYYLRKMFGESKGTSRFIITSNNGRTLTVCWPKALTWVIVIPVL